MADISDISIRFAEANRQEQSWLRDEIQDLRCLLWAIAMKNGGSICVEEKMIELAKGQCVHFVRHERERKLEVKAGP